MEDQTKMDYWQQRLKGAKGLISEENYNLISQRLTHIRKNLSLQTHMNNTKILMAFGIWCGKRSIKKLSESEVEDYFDTLNNQALITKIVTMQTIKAFLRQKFFKDGKQVTVNPALADTIIIPKYKNDINPDDLLTREEMEAVIKCCVNNRDRAMFACFWDSGARKSELLNTQIKHAKFDDNGCVLWLPISKSETRPARIIFAVSYLTDWLRIHPRKDDKNAYIFCSLQEPYGKLSDNGLYGQLKRIKARTGIEKRITCHAWRHTRATDLATKLTEQELKIVLGWAKNSPMPSVYVHLSGKDIDAAMLKAAGLKPKQEEKPDLFAPERCPRCGAINDKSRDFCHKCGLILSEKKRLEIAEQERKQKEEEITAMETKMKNIAAMEIEKYRVHLEEYQRNKEYLTATPEKQEEVMTIIGKIHEHDMLNNPQYASYFERLQPKAPEPRQKNIDLKQHSYFYKT